MAFEQDRRFNSSLSSSDSSSDSEKENIKRDKKKIKVKIIFVVQSDKVLCEDDESYWFGILLSEFGLIGK